MEVTFVRFKDYSDKMIEVLNHHLASTLNTAIKVVNFEHLSPADFQESIKNLVIEAVCQQNACALIQTTQMLGKIKSMGQKLARRAKSNIATRHRVHNDEAVTLVASVIECVITSLSSPFLAESARLQELGCLFLGKIANSTKFRESVNGGIMAAKRERMGAAELVLSSWRRHGEPISRACSQCLSLLARSAAISQHIDIDDIDFILSELRSSRDPEPAASTLMVLTLLLLEDDLRSKMKDFDVVETVLRAMRTFEDDAKVQWTACQALCKMAQPDVSGTNGGMRASLVTSKLAKKLGLPDSPSRSPSAANHTSECPSRPSWQERMASKGCASIIARAMRRHVDSDQVQQHGQSALESLSDTEGLRAVLIVETQRHRAGGYQGDASNLNASVPFTSTSPATTSRKSMLASAAEDSLRHAREVAFQEANLSPVCPAPRTLHHYHLSQAVLSPRQGRVTEVLDATGSPVARRLVDEGGGPGHLSFTEDDQRESCS